MAAAPQSLEGRSATALATLAEKFSAISPKAALDLLLLMRCPIATAQVLTQLPEPSDPERRLALARQSELC